MSLLSGHTMLPADDGSGRRAPSAIINACKGLVPWQYLLGTGWLAMGATSWWLSYLSAQWVVVVTKATGRPGNTGVGGVAEYLTSLAALVPVLYAMACLRCGMALKKFVRSGLLADLHPAMKRLRAVWRTMALTMLVIFVITLVAVVLLVKTYLKHMR